MNSRKRNGLIFLLFIACLTTSQAQDRYRFGSLPSINFNKGLTDRYAVNFNWQSRQIYQTGVFNEFDDPEFTFNLNDFTLLGSRKVGLNNTVTAGYLFRIINDQITHRSIQQFILVRRVLKFRMAHRFATDQTFEENNKAQFRIRYRFTGEIPLNGQSTDSKEFYLKVNNEYLNSLQGKEYDLEIRVIAMLGRVISQKCKLELGFDYRVNEFLDTGSSQTLWVAINAYFKI